MGISRLTNTVEKNLNSYFESINDTNYALLISGVDALKESFEDDTYKLEVEKLILITSLKSHAENINKLSRNYKNTFFDIWKTFGIK